jgi:hypothetical protein
MTETYVLLRRDWTAANVLALASEGLAPVLAGAEMIIFGRPEPQAILRSSTHDALLAAKEAHDQTVAPSVPEDATHGAER